VVNEKKLNPCLFNFCIVLFSEEYERVNAELRMRIATLETVTSSLKSGLVNNFQRKTSV
jgi:hypothetical protein